VPLAAIDTVTMRQTLNVWVGEQRFVCIGIGQGIRSRRKDRGDRPSLLGTSRWHEFSEMAKKAAPDQTAMSYQSWVVVRIEELVEQAKKARGGEAGAHEVRRSLAVPELALLALTAVAFVVTFLV